MHGVGGSSERRRREEAGVARSEAGGVRSGCIAVLAGGSGRGEERGGRRSKWLHRSVGGRKRVWRGAREASGERGVERWKERYVRVQKCRGGLQKNDRDSIERMSFQYPWYRCCSARGRTRTMSSAGHWTYGGNGVLRNFIYSICSESGLLSLGQNQAA
jgi:hypothetical protein